MQDSKTAEHVHTWEACRVGMNVTDYVMCIECEEIDPPVPPRIGQLVPDVIDAINAEAERQAAAAPFLAQYQRGLLTVAELIMELQGTFVGPVEPTWSITTLGEGE